MRGLGCNQAGFLTAELKPRPSKPVVRNAGQRIPFFANNYLPRRSLATSPSYGQPHVRVNAREAGT